MLSASTFRSLLVASAILGAACSLHAAPVSALEVTHLRCEFSKNPLGIDSAHPRLFWELNDGEHGAGQSAWEILVASSPDLLAQDKGDLWDSGRVPSTRTTFVHYEGRSLTSSERVYWKVRAWDRQNRPTSWSKSATWTMGVLDASDWKGRWICAQGSAESILMRKEFTVKPDLKRAVVDVCGLGCYEMDLNGGKVSPDLLEPGWTNYDRTTLYDTYDITADLHAGRNAVGLVLGNSMYNVVRRNRFVKFKHSFGPKRAILQIRLEYADGTVDYVGTDNSWRTHAGATTYDNIYGGEDYDARLYQAGWDKPGFEDSAWHHAVYVVRPGNTLRGHSVSDQPLRAIAVRKAVFHKKLPDGSVIYDLGQNTSYMPRIVVSGPAGSTVRLTPSEVLNPDGTINRGTMGGTGRGLSWWQYTKATDKPETWFPKFFYVGCRYLKVDFMPPGQDRPGEAEAKGEANLPTIDSIEGVMVHSSAPPVGDFKTSNELLNRIRMLVRWAQCSNMVSVLTDCPHREKLGWLEQYHLNGPSIRYEFDVNRIFTKGMNDMADSQTPDGLIPNIAPEFTKFRGTFRAAAEWGASFILVPWQQYHFTGDEDLLREHFRQMKRYFAYLETRAKDNILSEGLGDWYDLGPKKPGRAQLTPPPVTATAFFFKDASVLGKIATVLGHPKDARHYAARAAEIRDSYNRTFYHVDKGSYATGSQCANALPLVMGIVEPSQRARVLEALVENVKAHGYSMTAGDIGFRFLLQALAQNGRSDVIYRMIDQDDKPGYGYELKKGATALTESWDANMHSSHDHFMLGQITEWFYRDLVGIDYDPKAPGFKHILLHPAPVGDLKWAQASYDSIHGRISARWDHDGDTFTYKVTIPANTTATVYLPAKAGAPVLEGGKAVGSRPGIVFLRREGDRALYAIESGSYDFESKL